MITTPSDLKTYKKDLKRALQNQFLGATLDNFATAFKASRTKAFEGIDLDALIAEIAAGKDAAIPYLEELFAAFKARAEAAGIKVHVAHTAFEANSIIADIARANGVKKIVKGKSMTAEETFLNDHLEKDGFVVTETDLGEWIIQLRHEGPSHMVMPAIHLSRKEVAELFTQGHRAGIRTPTTSTAWSKWPGGNCARPFSKPTWASPGPILPSLRRERSASSPMRATDVW